MFLRRFLIICTVFGIMATGHPALANPCSELLVQARAKGITVFPKRVRDGKGTQEDWGAIVPLPSVLSLLTPRARAEFKILLQMPDLGIVINPLFDGTRIGGHIINASISVNTEGMRQLLQYSRSTILEHELGHLLARTTGMFPDICKARSDQDISGEELYTYPFHTFEPQLEIFQKSNFSKEEFSNFIDTVKSFTWITKNFYDHRTLSTLAKNLSTDTADLENVVISLFTENLQPNGKDRIPRLLRDARKIIGNMKTRLYTF